jgi:hypothetical protein
MRSYLSLGIFLFGAPALILTSFLLLSQISHTPSALIPGSVLSSTTITEDYLYPQTIGKFGTTDARAYIIKSYLKRYASPLLPHAQTIVDISDKYSLDYRLLVAIARQESNLCKKIPADSHNCWGFGIYGDKVTRFDNYPQALETVAKTLKKKYIDIGLTTPQEIMAKYTPPSIDLGGPWAKAVNQFMLDLE